MKYKEKGTGNSLIMKRKCTLESKLLNDGWFCDTKEMIPWIMAGQVLVNNQPASSYREKIPVDAVIRIKEYYKYKYVNKGGLKLEGAIKHFNIDVKGNVALDCGASTGGFTDCLVAFGARKVYAVDVGYGQLAGKLMLEPKVINMERTNLSDSSLKELEERPELISLDLSYLSLKKAVPICEEILENGKGVVLCLVKPIYEVESSEVRRNGNINDENFFKEILSDLASFFRKRGYYIIGITNSPVTGNKGTIEFFIGLELGGTKVNQSEEVIESQIMEAIRNGFGLHRFKKDASIMV